jgi:hypothetical protein
MTGPKSGHHVRDDAVLFIVTAPTGGFGPQVARVTAPRLRLPVSAAAWALPSAPLHDWNRPLLPMSAHLILI